ncbi:unnamed protein product [Caenorhabditis angaria]|uniref:Uncharacterized protein n=1 Tax=Caenorhabditis angaria TaxID=860376 RepID=A0A9P1IWJ3_9PELO|nr:unnamed protein product [Caenorhabditis angaria]
MMKFVKNKMKPTLTPTLPEDVTAIEIGNDVVFVRPVVVHQVNRREMQNSQGIQDAIDTINRLSRPTILGTESVCSRDGSMGFSPARYRRMTQVLLPDKLSTSNNNEEEKRSTWSCLEDAPLAGPSPTSVENKNYIESPSFDTKYDSLPRAQAPRDLWERIDPPVLPPNRPPPKPFTDNGTQTNCCELDFTVVQTESYEGTSAIDGMTPDEIRRQIEEIEEYIYKSFTTEDVMHIIQQKIDDAVAKSEKRVEKNVKEVKKEVKDIAKSVSNHSDTLNTIRMEINRKQRGSLGLEKERLPALFVPPPVQKVVQPTTPEDPNVHEPLGRQQSDASHVYYRF